MHSSFGLHSKDLIISQNRLQPPTCNFCRVTARPEDSKEQTKSFTAIGAFSGAGGNIADDRAAPQQVRGQRLPPNVFSLLGQQPLFGRDFAPGDDAPGAERVVLLGYRVWKKRYGDDRSIIGRTLRIDGKPATIIGVMPEG